MPTTTAFAAPSTLDSTAPVVAPVSELDAARARVAPLLEQIEAGHGRPLTVGAAEAAASTVRAVAALQSNRR